MDNIEIIETTIPVTLEVIPDQKISITHGSRVFVYWYVKYNSDDRNLNKEKDIDLLKLMDAKGMNLEISKFESFNDYHLIRKDKLVFIFKSLK